MDWVHKFFLLAATFYYPVCSTQFVINFFLSAGVYQSCLPHGVFLYTIRVDLQQVFIDAGGSFLISMLARGKVICVVVFKVRSASFYVKRFHYSRFSFNYFGQNWRICWSIKIERFANNYVLIKVPQKCKQYYKKALFFISGRCMMMKI